MRREFLICLALSILTLIAFWPAGNLGFILYDDGDYVVNNPRVQEGITAESVGWAFTTLNASNWHPVTWLSLMLDCELFGPNAAGHHWTSLGFHIANTLLLFLVLRKMTGTVWRSAMVAALFAWHPLRVESVAWISERKDVLSGFFFMLTLWAWVRYVEKSEVRSPKSEVESQKSKANNQVSNFRLPASGHYWLALVFFALGLMSKPMLVTLPFVLLLLDAWPLKRISEFGARSSDLKSVPQLLGGTMRSEGGSTLNHLLLEKAPFLVLSLASCVVTLRAQSAGGAVIALSLFPCQDRCLHAVLSYSLYLGKLFWPVNLAFFYPYALMKPGVLVCLVLLPLLLTLLCLWRARVQPYLMAGWSWFVLTLVPVIGLVQTGMQSIADRYTYLPSIGVFIIVAWGMAGLASVSRFWRPVIIVGAAALPLACLPVTRHQLGYWHDSATLFGHSVAVTGENAPANLYLGNALWLSGDLNNAANNYRVVTRLAPGYADAHYRLGYVLLLQKKAEVAESQLREALRLNPQNIHTHWMLGQVLIAEEKFAEATNEFAIALQLQPDNEKILNVLASTTQKAEAKNAVVALEQALKNQPTPETHARLAAGQTALGKYPDAVGHYHEALRLRPDAPDILNNLAWLLATCPDASVRNSAEAVQLAGRACELTDYKTTVLVGTLAAAYAEAGQFDEAMAAAQKACALASEHGETELLQRNQELLELYRAHQPYHEGANLPEATAIKPFFGNAEKLVPAAP